MRQRSKDYYPDLFDSELSLAQAILENQTSFWKDIAGSHITLCAAILPMFSVATPSDYARFHHAKDRLMELRLNYEKKRMLWATSESSIDIEKCLEFD